MGRLNKKVAIVTGSAGGIGRAIALRFAAEGAALVCVDIATERLEETAAAITAEGGRCETLASDVALEETAVEAVRLAGTLGGLDILVNDAVHDLPFKPLTEISLAEWQRTMDVNLTGAFLMSRHAIPAMERRGGGAIIHVASQLGRVARPGRPWYCAQKAALINLARAMALDHAAQNIRVNTL